MDKLHDYREIIDHMSNDEIFEFAGKYGDGKMKQMAAKTAMLQYLKNLSAIFEEYLSGADLETLNTIDSIMTNINENKYSKEEETKAIKGLIGAFEVFID